MQRRRVAVSPLIQPLCRCRLVCQPQGRGGCSGRQGEEETQEDAAHALRQVPSAAQRTRQRSSCSSRPSSPALCSAPPPPLCSSPCVAVSVYQVLKDVHPGMNMTRRGMIIMENFIQVQQRRHTPAACCSAPHTPLLISGSLWPLPLPHLLLVLCSSLLSGPVQSESSRRTAERPTQQHERQHTLTLLLSLLLSAGCAQTRWREWPLSCASTAGARR